MSENKWDREEYNRQMSAVRSAANAFSSWISSGLGRSEVDQLEAWADGKISHLKLTDAIKAYKNETARLHDLHKTMKEYLTSYEDMIKRSENRMDNVQEVNSVYGSFGNILTGISASAAAALTASKAYQFGQSGKTFSGDYNDMTAFMHSDVYKVANGFLGLSQINNWEMYAQTISSAITGGENEYVTDLLRSGLKSMVEGIPGSEPVSFSNLNWDIIGAKLGIENLGKYMYPVNNLLMKISNGTPSDDDFKELSTKLSLVKEVLKGVKGAKVLVSMLEGFGDALGVVGTADTLVDYASELFANHFNTYADQISYLNTLRDSFEAAGYWTDSPVMQEINELQKLYEDKVLKSLDYSWKNIMKGEIGDIAKDAIVKEVPVLGGVDTFFDVASKTSVLYGNDRVEAAQALMGYYQYDNMLTQTFEKYSSLVESGAATEVEIAETDRLYDMLQTLKIKEYEAMKTISKDYDQSWYNIASNKLDSLEGRRSGGGRSGSGRRG